MPRADKIAWILEDPFRAHLTLFPKRHFADAAEFHTDLVKLLWSFDPRGAGLLFRGSAKTTYIEERVLLGALMEDFHYAVICCSTERHARDRLLSIKNELNTNEEIEWVFGNPRGEVWQADRLVLSNGRCIDAVSAGQNTRGMKYLTYRPEQAFVDDLEEMSPRHDNVSTPEKREELRRWFTGAFLPALARPSPVIRLAGTMLHEDSLVGRYSKADGWRTLTVPIEYVGLQGKREASWPALFPLEWIDQERVRYLDDGQTETFEQEYMCRAAAPETRAFRESNFRFEPKVRTWEPVYVIYDPARTVGPKSCATGKVVASWLGGRLLVWEAIQAFWQPSELIDDMFDSDVRWSPLEIGVEVTGLNQFVEQPLRIEQARRGHRLPLRSLNPPRGPGKENFLLRLQPIFANGEVVFCGERQQFKKLVNELLGFPYGLKDTLNALAYMLEIKPGEPVYARFRNEHVADSLKLRFKSEPYLLLNSDGFWSCAILVESANEGLRVMADWCDEGGLAEVVPANIRAARARAGRGLTAYCPSVHFKPFDSIGLRPAARSADQTVLQGGDITAGQTEMRRLLAFRIGETALFQIAREASWTIRAMSGGYARQPGETAPQAGPYRVIGEALDSFAAVLGGVLQETYEGANIRYTADGRKYLSSSARVRQ
jgi:hypothetical protein